MDILAKERKLRELESKIEELDNESLIAKLKEEIEIYKLEAMSNLTAWDRVLIARHQNRPVASDYIDYIFEDFIEFSDPFFKNLTLSKSTSVNWQLTGGYSFYEKNGGFVKVENRFSRGTQGLI